MVHTTPWAASSALRAFRGSVFLFGRKGAISESIRIGQRSASAVEAWCAFQGKHLLD